MTRIALAFSLLFVCSPLAAQSNVLFRSEFESGVTLAPPRVAASQWWQDLDGADFTGYEWSAGLPSATSEFQFQVGTANAPTALELGDYIENRIDTVIGPYDSPTRALYLEVKADDPAFVGTSRTNFLMYGEASGVLEEAYCREWVKLQPDLESIMQPYAWRVVAEWMETSDQPPPAGIDYRVTLFVNRRASHPTPYWSLQAEQVLPTRVNEWTEDNYGIPVPTGEWFELEMYWKRSTGPDGEYWIAINGVTIFHRTGKNMKDSGLKSFQPFKCYTGTNSLAIGPAYQWIDGFELRDGRPAATSYGCGLNPSGSLTVLGGGPFLGGPMTFGVDDPTNTQVQGATPLLMFAYLAEASFPCGLPIPGFGMAGNGAPGEFLLWPQTIIGAPILGAPWTSGPAAFGITWPNFPALLDLSLRAQGGLWDPTPGAKVPLGLTDALQFTFR